MWGRGRGSQTRAWRRTFFLMAAALEPRSARRPRLAHAPTPSRGGPPPLGFPPAASPGPNPKARHDSSGSQGLVGHRRPGPWPPPLDGQTRSAAAPAPQRPRTRRIASRPPPRPPSGPPQTPSLRHGGIDHQGEGAATLGLPWPLAPTVATTTGAQRTGPGPGPSGHPPAAAPPGPYPTSPSSRPQVQTRRLGLPPPWLI